MTPNNQPKIKKSWHRLFCLTCGVRGWNHEFIPPTFSPPDHDFVPDRQRRPPHASTLFKPWQVLICYGHGMRWLDSAYGFDSEEAARVVAALEVKRRNTNKTGGAECWTVVLHVEQINVRERVEHEEVEHGQHTNEI